MFGYIDFINKYCNNEIVSRALHAYYIKGYKQNIMINGILEYSDIFQSDFKSDIEKYRDIFIIYLKSRFEQNFLDISYVPDTKQDTVEKFWGDGNFANIWLTFQDIVTKYQTPYFFNVAKDYLKGSILDIGGGSGSLSDSLKKIDNSLNFTVLDLPDTIDRIQKYKDIKYIGDNILTHNYENYDVCICKDILKCFNEKDILNILSKLKNSVNTIVIHESMGKMLEKADSPFFQSEWALEILSHYKPEFYFNIAKKIGMNVSLHKTCDKNGYDTIILTK
jgi:2-polyprenyl-3-methyl-5-hydroxy-6-metoxy-1,4-benzoquinol methylase